MDNAKTGQLITSIRKNKNMTQQDIAEKLHITSKAVSKWERGLSFPSIDILENLAIVLNITVMDLLAGEIIQEKDITEISCKISVQVLKKEKKIHRKLIVVCAVFLLLVTATLLSMFGPVIFQRGNPIPYLVAATKISDEQPYVRVDVNTNAEIFISKRDDCPELFEYIEIKRDLEFFEQAGSAYIFSNGSSNLIVISEIYWSKYIVWKVPQITLKP